LSQNPKDFKFHIPVELLKSEDEQEWRVGGIASTPDEDLQEEVVHQDGLDISVLKAGRGLFNWDHQKGPENVLGQIDDAEFKTINGKRCLYVEGYLFKNQERSKAFYNILNSLKKGNGPRVHMSIEGKILQRDDSDKKKIKKARIEKVALTLDPVNPYTYADLIKSLNAEEVISPQPIPPTPETITLNKEHVVKLVELAQKAMAAGAGYAGAPQALSGSEAMASESLDAKTKKINRKKKRKDMLKSILVNLREKYPNESLEKMAKLAVQFLNKKGLADG
jgi:hypothetical protein